MPPYLCGVHSKTSQWMPEMPLVVTSTFLQKARDSDCNHRVAGKLACQAQNGINVEQHSPNNLLGSGHSPMYACSD